MSFTFIDYLVEVEQTLSFDPEKETPDELVKRAKQAMRVGAASPERALRAQQQEIKNQTADLKANKDDPFARERLQIKQMEDRIARMKMLLARKEQMAGAGR